MAHLLAPLLADAWRGFCEPDGDLRAVTPKIEIPVWPVWAKGDRFVSRGRARSAALHLPDHRVTLFNCGHSAFLENPDAFANGFLAFARDLHCG